MTRCFGIIATYMLLMTHCAHVAGTPTNKPSIDTPVDQLQPTQAERDALAEIEKLIGKQFRVNRNGAPIEAFIGEHALTPELLDQLSKLKSLRALFLNRSKIANDDLKYVAALVNLKKLYLGETAAGDAGLEHLNGLTKLEYLHLGDTEVTSAGTRHLRGLTSLKILHLFNTKVDDGGLASLQGLSKLQLVSLNPATVTDEGVNKLQQALPKLVIQGKPNWNVGHPDSAKELSVSIAVPQRDSRRVIDLRQSGAYFNVVVTNRSKHDLRLWETWNSWGYFNLSFDVLDENGRVVSTVSKRPRAWTVNFPSWVTIKPGEHFVLKVDFDPDIWIWGGDVGDSRPAYLPFLSVMGKEPEFKLNLRAVFRILPDWETIENTVWTGTVKSAPDEFVIRHLPPNTDQSGQVYEDKARGFTMTLPNGWSATPTFFSMMHYRDVFLCINSQGKQALRVTHKRKGNTETYNPETVAEQLEPGAVYIDVAYFEGPGGKRSVRGKPDTVGSRPFQEKVEPTRLADGKLSRIEESFIKDERRWHVYAYFREPVKRDVRVKAEQLLRSFQFVDKTRTQP